MPGTVSPKPTAPAHKPAAAPAPPPTATMFGVAISTAPAHSVAEQPEMSQKKKRLILASGLIVATAFVLWLQYRPTAEADPDAADHPAVKQVVELTQKKDVAGLSQLARDTDVVVARRAVAAIGQMGDLGALRASLADRRPEVRSAAVSEMGERADVTQLPALSEYLKDPSPAVQIAAIRGIANVRDFSIFDHLVPMLSDPQPSVRRGALSAIEDRLGLRFDDFDATGSDAARNRAIARIKATIPNFKQHFDVANKYEANKQRK